MSPQIKPNVYIFFGPPGAGKGEQATRLSKALEIPHISSGDLLRLEAKKTTPFAEQLNHLLSQGQFPNDSCIIEIIKNRITQEDCFHGFILDGFPRTLNQAQVLDQCLSDSHNLILINITIAEKTLLERLLGRRICTHCARTFNINFLPPKKEKICDDCHGALITRDDDKEEIILKRFEIFNQKFCPIAQYYQGRSNWIEIKSEGSPQECFYLLIDQLEPLLNIYANA